MPSRVTTQVARWPRPVFLLAFLLLLSYFHSTVLDLGGDLVVSLSDSPHVDVDAISRAAERHSQSPIQPPYKHQFWELGQRSRKLAEWLRYAEQAPRYSGARRKLVAAIDETAASLFPYLESSPRKPLSKTPLSDLRASFDRGSRGIVIPVGGGVQNVRFACHLIASLRQVLDSKLPIQVVYAGDADLPERHRDALRLFDPTRSIEFLDVWTVFDDSTLRLADNGWAVKPFAALASRFEQVILMDADSVFLQDPEELFAQQGFIDTGAFLFHDRLLWQHAFPDRHDWWRDQIREPSPALNRSLVWTEDYAEECDSGVVVLDKSRPEVLAGLLHTAWQNTHAVREEVSYKITYGDKETWWLGLELAGSGYAFEDHYGSIVGWEKEAVDGDGVATRRVCSFVIAHVDERGRLLWYNGSLLKNKLVVPTKYEVPMFWMMDGKWEKGAAKKDMSCMVDGEMMRMTGDEITIARESTVAAMGVDQMLRNMDFKLPRHLLQLW